MYTIITLLDYERNYKMSNKVYSIRLDKSREEKLNFIISSSKDNAAKILSEGLDMYYDKLTGVNKEAKSREILNKAFKYIMSEFKKLWHRCKHLYTG